ncbi:MAG: MFS transporter [Nitrospirales bacterium]|nr:MAG: MFS transporter [Nitrospirales bacterium]
MSPPRTFALLCAVAFLAFVSYDLVRRPALALFAGSLGATPVTVGILVALSTVTGIFVKLPVGVMSDLLDRRKFMIGGLLAFALPPFFYPVISDVTILGTLRLAHGLATALFTPLALAMVAQLYAERRGEAMGWYTAAAQGGGLLGPMLGGILVYAVGFSSTFLMAGAFGTLSLVLFLCMPRTVIPAPRLKRTHRTFMTEVRQGVKDIVRHRGILTTSLTEASKMMANGTLMAFLPLYGLSIGLNAAQVGVLFGIQALTSLFAKPAMGKISDRTGRHTPIVIGLCLCGAMLILIPQLETLKYLLIVSAVFGLGEAVITSSSTALIADLSHHTSIGAGMGMRGTIMDIGHAAGPVIAGILIASIGYRGGFAVIGIFQFITAGVFGMIMEGNRRRTIPEERPVSQ